MLCELQCNVLWAVCSVCQGKGSITQKVQELETRVLLMDHQQQINKLLLEERQQLVEQLQKDEVKTERDKLKQILEKQRVEQLQWTEGKVVSMATGDAELPGTRSGSQP